MTTTVAVVGATGKLGSLIARLVRESADYELVAALSSANPLSDMDGADLVVDVTHPAVTRDVVERAIAQGSKVLVGTSGWSDERVRTLAHTQEGTPDAGVVIIPNFSIG